MVMDCVLRNTSVWINKVYCNCVAGLLEVRIVWSSICACRVIGNCSTPGFVLQEGELLAEEEYTGMPLFEMMSDKLTEGHRWIERPLAVIELSLGVEEVNGNCVACPFKSGQQGSGPVGDVSAIFKFHVIFEEVSTTHMMTYGTLWAKNKSTPNLTRMEGSAFRCYSLRFLRGIAI